MIPTTREEYEKRFFENNKFSGFGTNTTVHMPCPFCAAPDWLTYRVIDSQTGLAKGAVCAECGRSAKGLVERDQSGIRLEIVQTGGLDPPPWLPPMRRVE